MKNGSPIYIPSKGRYESRLTVKYLDQMGLDYTVIVEDQEHDLYAQHIDESKLLVLNRSFQESYETCDEFGTTRPVGSGAVRNFAWHHSMEKGHQWHWVMDDNIRRFCRLNNNKLVSIYDGAFFKAMEDFTQRFTNVAMAGPNYFMFVPRKAKIKPFVTNTRIFSCNLIKNDIPFRWRGRYNEDAILSLDILKAGLCTIQFNAFLQQKMTTQSMKGGNTDVLYANGTQEKSQMLVNVHPDVARLSHKFGRDHHHIDFKPFKKNMLIQRYDYKPTAKPNEYGLKLKKKEENNASTIKKTGRAAKAN